MRHFPVAVSHITADRFWFTRVTPGATPAVPWQFGPGWGLLALALLRSSWAGSWLWWFDLFTSMLIRGLDNEREHLFSRSRRTYFLGHSCCALYKRTMYTPHLRTCSLTTLTPMITLGVPFSPPEFAEVVPPYTDAQRVLSLRSYHVAYVISSTRPIKTNDHEVESLGAICCPFLPPSPSSTVSVAFLSCSFLR